MVTYDIAAEPYRHWVLTIEPPVATLVLGTANETGTALSSLLRPDIELSDALQRLRFEHPEVTAVVVTGAAGHAFTDLAPLPAGAPADVVANVAAFHNEVWSAIEDASADSGLVAFAATERRFADAVRERAMAAAGGTGRGPESEAVELGPLWREEFDGGFAYPNLRVEFDEAAGAAVLTIVGPSNHECFAPEPGPKRLRSHWWPLALCRELDDALLLLRSNSPSVHSLVLRTEGDPLAVASADVALTSGYEHDWFVREVVLYWKRTLKRLDRSWQSVIALIEPGSCFVGTLLELAFAADRLSMVDSAAVGDADDPPAEIFLTGMNFGPLPMANGLTRLESRFLDREGHLAVLGRRVGDPISAAEAAELGLVPSKASGTSR